MSDAAIIEFRDVFRTFGKGDRCVSALGGVSLRMAPGEFVAVTGPSGSGKSTLLHLAGGLDRPTSGSVHVAGYDLGSLNEVERTELRSHAIGFVFQFFHLLPTLTIRENVALPLLLRGARLRDTKSRLDGLLESMGLSQRAEHRPGALSGGEMQRAALARALIIDPDVILADEPTGNLDSANGARVLDLLVGLAKDAERPRTIMMVTHDTHAASRADRSLRLHDGRLRA